MGKGKKARSPEGLAFGGAVREWRGRHRLSQEALGNRADLHRNYVGAVERGEVNPTLRITIKLARGLRTRPSELLRLAERHHKLIARWEAEIDSDLLYEWRQHGAEMLAAEARA